MPVTLPFFLHSAMVADMYFWIAGNLAVKFKLP